MELTEIKKIELSFLKMEDYKELKAAMIEAYTAQCLLERAPHSNFD